MSPSKIYTVHTAKAARQSQFPDEREKSGYIVLAMDDQRIIENPILRRNAEEGEPATIDLDGSANETGGGGSEIAKILGPAAENRDKTAADGGNGGGKGYRIAFLLELVPWTGGRRWVVSPMCRYVKSDGSRGSFQAYSRHRLTSPPGREEKALLGRLLARDGHRDELLNHVDFLLANPVRSLYWKTDSSRAHVSFERIRGLTVRFVPDSVKGGLILFRPVLDAVGDEATVLKGLSSGEEILLYGFTLVLLGAAGPVLFRDGEDMLSEVLRVVFFGETPFTYRDIRELKEVCSQKIPSLHAELPPRRIVLRSPVPKPFVEIEQRQGGVTASLWFSYGGGEALSKKATGRPSGAPLGGTGDVPYGAGRDLIFLKGEKGGFTVARRSFDYEKEVFAYFAARFKHLVRRVFPSNSFHAASPALDFLVSCGREMLDEGFELRLKGEKGKPSAPISSRKGRVGITVSSGVDWLDLKTRYRGEDGSELDVSIERGLLAGGLVKAGNSYVIVTKEEVAKLTLLLEEGMSAGGSLRLSRYRLALIDELYESVLNREDERVREVGKVIERLRDFNAIEHQKLPRGFHGALRDYQQAGLDWLFFLRDFGMNGCLADDMGLGKTVQALAFLQKLKERGELSPSLIVVPVTTMLNWEAEIKKFTPGLNYALHYGPDRGKNGDFAGYDVIITSYHTLRKDIGLFGRLRYKVLLLDESQQIKNPGSLLWRACRVLDAGTRLSLTGTPIENNTFELWAQMEVLNPGLLGTRREFRERFAKPIEAEGSQEAAAQLRKRIFPFILRRKKEDVAKELPPKSEILLYSEMEERQAELYAGMRDRYREAILTKIDREGMEKSAIEIFSALLRLRQVALFPGLVDPRYGGHGSCKYEQLIALVKEILQEDHKLLIFSQFVKALKIIRENFEKERIEFSYIDGSMSAKSRGQEVRRFGRKDGPKLFLLSLKAGGLGINLTAADYVILFDPWWNPAVESQAIDRTHRIGQTQKVIAYRLIVKGTVEEKVLELQEKKKRLLRELISAESGFFKSLTKEDIMGLFQK